MFMKTKKILHHLVHCDKTKILMCRCYEMFTEFSRVQELCRVVLFIALIFSLTISFAPRVQTKAHFLKL
jgi:hypothetical protein